ncbi:MAG: DinB family protein [Hyphomicrobiales bacterium]
MDDFPATRAAIQERFEAAVRELNAALGELSAGELVRPGAVGEWSLKDTLAHLSSTWLAGQLEAYLDGRTPTAATTFGFDDPPPPGTDLATNDGRNAWLHTSEARLTLPEVRERYEEFLRRTNAAIARLPEDDFGRAFALAPLGHVGQLRPAVEGDGPPIVPLWRWLAGNTWHHFEEHLPAFQAAAAVAQG